MDGQIDLFEILEQEQWQRRHEAARLEWEKVPQFKPCSSDCRWWNYAIWVHKVHICKEKPEDVDIWQNTFCPGEFWVMNDPGEIQGRRIDSCPFCHCDLSRGQGARFLEKRDKFV